MHHCHGPLAGDIGERVREEMVAGGFVVATAPDFQFPASVLTLCAYFSNLVFKHRITKVVASHRE